VKLVTAAKLAKNTKGVENTKEVETKTMTMNLELKQVHSFGTLQGGIDASTYASTCATFYPVALCAK
jgi:hypothetical protein